jgi:hypothetical protein
MATPHAAAAVRSVVVDRPSSRKPVCVPDGSHAVTARVPISTNSDADVFVVQDVRAHAIAVAKPYTSNRVRAHHRTGDPLRKVSTAASTRSAESMTADSIDTRSSGLEVLASVACRMSIRLSPAPDRPRPFYGAHAATRLPYSYGQVISKT